MTDLRAGEVIYILDILDEYEELRRYKIIYTLNTFYSSFKGTITNLKFFITS
jgi:hypothetical protein